ncbi:MAG: PLD nuclease N-terminal domain-containing protein [Micrococcales bacterium]
MNPLMPAGADILFSVVVLASVGVMIWALVDLWKSKAEQNTKILWTLLVVMFNPIGAIIWFAVGKKANQ